MNVMLMRSMTSSKGTSPSVNRISHWACSCLHRCAKSRQALWANMGSFVFIQRCIIVDGLSSVMMVPRIDHFLFTRAKVGKKFGSHPAHVAKAPRFEVSKFFQECFERPTLRPKGLVCHANEHWFVGFTCHHPFKVVMLRRLPRCLDRCDSG